MATNLLFKRYAGATDRKTVLQKIYDALAVTGDTNASVIDEIGGYHTNSPTDADYFVVEFTAPWADADVHQQFVIAANDTTGSLTFGGAAGNKWTIPAKTITIVYSPDGGWNTTSKDFADRVGSLTETQRNYSRTTTVAPGYDISAATAPGAFVLWGLEATFPVAMFVGIIESTDTNVADARPCVMFWGLLSLNNQAPNSWANRAAGSIAGVTPDTVRGAWYTCSTEATGLLDTCGQQKNSGAWVEDRLPIYSVSSLKFVGTFGILKRISTALANGDVKSDSSRCAWAGVSFPWSA